MAESTEKKKITRANSSAVTLSDIKLLIEDMRKDVTDTMNRGYASLNKSIEETNTRLSKLEEANDNLRSKNKKLKEEIKNLKISSENNLESIADEIHLRHLRQANLIIFGVPEKVDGSINVRKDCDIVYVNEILKELNIEFDVARNFLTEPPIRIGRPKDNGVRPLRIICASMTMKNKILRASTSLKDKEQYRAVFIHPDWTPMQQVGDKKLRAELKRRKEAGEDVIVRRGKIVEKQNFPDCF